MEPLTKHKQTIWEFLPDFLTKKKEELQGIPWSQQVLEQLQTFSLHGKLIRGSLTLLSHEMFGNQNTNAAAAIAAALELNQSAILIHDDIIDADDMRRGQKSLHKQYEEIGNNYNMKNLQQFGKSQALCVGDIGFFLCFELLNKMKAPEEIKQKLIELYAQEMQLVGYAEMQDVYAGMITSEVTAEEILNLYKLKTGRYTFGLPLVMGAILAGKTNTESLMKLGTFMGLIFQLTDDELSLFGKETQTGKPEGTDIIRNNKTLHRLYLLETITGSEKQKALAIFGNPHASMTDISYIRDLMRIHQVTDKIGLKISEFESDALRLIERLDITNQHQQMLKDLAIFCQTRTA